MKEWWQDFFKPMTSEVMFKPRQGKQTEMEVAQVLKQLQLDKNAKILDLCCGEGRHSLLFAEAGYEVVGLDYSPHFLKVARQQAARRKQLVKFVTADMKQTSRHFEKKEFDAVVSLYNSFGYFNKRADDFKTLREVHKVLKPGGYFIVNTVNGSGAKVRLATPLSQGHEISKNLFVIDKARLDFGKMRTYSTWTIIDARKKKTEIFRGSFEQNIYSHKEMKALLKKAGFRVKKTWGILGGGPFDEKTSWHQTVMAQKI